MEKMKKSKLTETHTEKRTLRMPLTSFKRALNIFGDETKVPQKLQVSMKKRSTSFLNHKELQRINMQLLKLERLDAEGIRLTRDHARCI